VSDLEGELLERGGLFTERCEESIAGFLVLLLE
jgi:hypothetical protein